MDVDHGAMRVTVRTIGGRHLEGERLTVAPAGASIGGLPGATWSSVLRFSSSEPHARVVHALRAPYRLFAVIYIVKRSSSNLSRRWRRLLFLLPLLLALRPAWAASVLQVDVDELLERAALVFEGRVTASRADWNQARTSIVTTVRFAVLDVIKGEHPGDELALRFMGGSVDGLTLQIPGMVQPRVGERGIYFVETLARDQINPLLGWSQGHFRLRADAQGVQRVLTEDGMPVRGLEPGSNPAQAARTAARPALSEGRALGLALADDRQRTEEASDSASFKRALRTRLESIRAGRGAGPSAR